MKRIIYSLFILTISLVFAACAQRNTDYIRQSEDNIQIGRTQVYLDTPKIVSYIDGTYTAQGDLTDEGNQVATVSIKNGKIDGVTLYSVNRNNDNFSAVGNTQAEKTNNPTGVRGTSVNNPVGGTAEGSKLLSSTENTSNDIRKKLANSILQKQSYDVSVSSDNPQMVNNWKLAVKRALTEASK
jgi:hypothetical protein